MGILIGFIDYAARIFPVEPMPSWETNLLGAIQSMSDGKSIFQSSRCQMVNPFFNLTNVE
jgi:hypothetical protein